MNRGALVLLMVAIGAAGCVVVPTRPTTPIAAPTERLVGARFAVEWLRLTTVGGLPSAGSKDHERLRSYLVQQLNAAAGTDTGAQQVLPTRVMLERVAQLFKSGETLKIAITTGLADGRTVETTGEAEDRRPGKGSSACGPFAPSALNSNSGCASAATSGAGILGVLIVPLLAVACVALVVAAAPFVIYSATQADQERTFAFSDGIQRVAIAHARKVRQAMAAPTPEPAVAEQLP